MQAYVIAKLKEINEVDCPCGKSKRAFVDQPDKVVSLHRVEIKRDSEKHYHKKTTEVYYILEGSGEMELDDEVIVLEPDMSILIRPGCRHRASGDMKIINFCLPAFDASDEYVVGQEET